MTELRTPAKIAETEEAIRCDLAEVTALFVEGGRLLEGLEESLRVLPSSQSRIKAWRNQIDHILGQIGEEQADVSRKLLGTEPVEISESVDEAHAANVVALRREA